jgi:hypothetical protein
VVKSFDKLEGKISFLIRWLFKKSLEGYDSYLRGQEKADKWREERQLMGLAANCQMLAIKTQ